MQLYPTPDNPIPGRAASWPRITHEDGITLRAARWMPPGETARHRLHPAGPGRVHREVFRDRGRAARARLRGRRLRLARPGPSGRQVRNPRKGHVRRFSRLPARSRGGARPGPDPGHAGAAFRPRPFDGRRDRARCAAYEGWLPFQRLVATAPMIALCIVKVRGWRPRLGPRPELRSASGGPSSPAAARPRSPRSPSPATA